MAALSKVDRLFVGAVVLPSLLAALYFGVLASDVYVSESTFVVRSADRQLPTGLMGSLLPGAALGGLQDESRLVHSYMRSRDALGELQTKLPLRQAYAADTIDRLSRFAGVTFDDSEEAFHRYWRERVRIEADPSSSLSILSVQAFDAVTAQRINSELLLMAERLVNRLNERIRADAVRLASLEVERAERTVAAAAREVASFRGANEVFDPDRQTALQLTQTSKLQEELVAARSQLAQLQAVSPDNPQVAAMQSRMTMLQREIAAGEARVVGPRRSLAQKGAEMQQLTVRQASADRQLGVALAALEQARVDARRQQLYLERISAPHRPDAPTHPKPVIAVLTTLVLGLLTWGLLSLVLAAVREHRA